MKKILSLLLAVWMASFVVHAAEATFNFANPSTLTCSKTITFTSSAFNTDGAVFTDNGVTLTTTDGGTESRLYGNATSADLRIYKSGGSLILTAPENQVITSIVFTGTSNVFSVTEGEYSSPNWTGSASVVKFTASGTAKIKTIKVTTEVFSSLETPTISYTDGTYYEGEDVLVTIAGTVPADATLKYTTDDTEPTADNGTEYTVPFNVNKTTTVKAAIVSATESSLTASATISFNPTYNTVADYKAAADGAMKINTPLYITYVNGNDLYAEDATHTGGILLTVADGSLYAAGKVIPAGVIGTKSTSSSTSQSEFAVTTIGEVADGTIEPSATAATELTADMVNQYVKFSAAELALVSGTEYTLNGTITLRNLGGKIEMPTEFTDKRFDVTGVVRYYSSKYEIVPTEVVEATAALPSPTISVPTGTYATEQTVTITMPEGASYIMWTTDDAIDLANDGKMETESKTVTIAKSCTLRALAGNDNYETSFPVAAVYTMKTAAPVITATGATDGVFTEKPLTVNIAAGNAAYTDTNCLIDGTITYEDGTSETFNKFGDIQINKSATITVSVAYGLELTDANFATSDVVTATYTYKDPNSKSGSIVIKDLDLKTIFGWTGSSKPLTAGTVYTITDDAGEAFSLTAFKDEGNTTIPAISKDQELRVYTNSGVSISGNDKIIKSVTLTFSNTNSTTINGTTVSSGQVWTAPNDGILSFDIKGTVSTYITQIDIEYVNIADIATPAATFAEVSAEGYYTVNEAVQVAEVNGTTSYAYNNVAATKCEPTEAHKTAGFDSYEDKNWADFDQRDWVAIENAGVDAGNEIAAGGVYYYDGAKFTPMGALNQATDLVNNLSGTNTTNSYNDYRAENILHGSYTNYDATVAYQAFYMMPKCNEVANFLGKVVNGQLTSENKFGTLNGNGVTIDGTIADNNAGEYSKFQGIIVKNDDAATDNIPYKIVLLGNAEITTGVEGVAADAEAKVIAAGGAINVAGADDVKVYTIGGALISTDARTEVAAGIYVVIADGVATKVIVK